VPFALCIIELVKVVS